MHGLNSGSTFLVNAEIDSMGGVVDGGVDIGAKPSPRRAAIEKAQAELRLEYDVREERRKELEFLEKGGDPLDFKFAHAALVTIQSTSHTDQDRDHNLTSEAKASFALTASPHGDSVESSGRLGVTTADNFDGEDEILQSDRKSMLLGRSNTIPSEESSQIDRNQNIKYLEDSPVFQSKEGQLYRRRNRSRLNCDDPRSDSTVMASLGENGSCMPARHGLLSKSAASENQFETESDGTRVMQSMSPRVTKSAEGKLDLSISKEKLQEVQNLSLKPAESLVDIRTVEPDNAVGRGIIETLNVDCPSSSGEEKIDCCVSSTKLNETVKVNGDENCTATEPLINNVTVTPVDVDSESSCSRTNVIVDGNGKIDSDLCANLTNVDSNGSPKEPKLHVVKNFISKDNQTASDDLVTVMDTDSCIKEDQSFVGYQGNVSVEEEKSEVYKGNSSQPSEAKGLSCVEGQVQHDKSEIKSSKELDQVDNDVPKVDSSSAVRPAVGLDVNEHNKNGISNQPSVLETQTATENQSKPLDKAHEDRILEEARTIVAKRKRIAALSVGLLLREHRQKCHWDLVLEEMSWLANDFAQERIWKMTAAAQICRRVAFASRLRFEKQSKLSKPKSVAHTLAKAVMEFWHLAKLSIENTDSSQLDTCKREASLGADKMEKASQDVLQSAKRIPGHAVYGYAVRFLQLNCSSKHLVAVEVPEVTDTACDVFFPEPSWQDQFTEENLFYAIPPSAMEFYRTSIEACLAEVERIGDNIQEEIVTSAHDATAGNNYEEDQGQHVYYQPEALDTGKPSKKKRKNIKLYASRSYEMGGDISYGLSAETGNGTTPLNTMGKRPTSNLHVDPIPIKRMRTASRPRVVGPFGAGAVGVTQVLSRADASSEDTNSFQDDPNTPHSGSVVPRALEVDSAMNFEKQSTYDRADMSAKPKKKKKIKHQSLYDQRWQLDSTAQNEQKDHVRKRLENHQLESNGDSGFLGQHAKKPKLVKNSLDNSFDYTAPMCGSVASPVASQMSNMSSQTKLIKIIGGRDRGKKGKGLKVSSGQPGSGSPWTIVEDQALVVLVHDMGPNWELVSDAINSILQFKCIFRKPQECKERHKFLMDRPSGDGADSGEDSGSSQPYPSTLPGIPKGSARQLFRSLHAHVEEDNIKSRFEKIIRIVQLVYSRKRKNDNQDMKQIAPAHSSHVLSLSQVIPNNLNGGVLTPLDLCDTAPCNQDPLPHAGGLALPNQGSIGLMNPPSGLNPQLQGLQGSPSMVIGANLASPSSQFAGARDARYSVPRSGSLPIEEQQRLHQYNSMLQARNVQASNLLSSGSDRGVRLHPAGNGGSVTPVMNRGIPMARPGVQGISSSATVLPPNVEGMPSNMNVPSGTASDRGNGNSMFRPREQLHGVRGTEHQRQNVLPGMQQTTQISSPGITAFGGLNSGFSNNQPTPYPGHHHPHVLNTPHSQMSTLEKQAYIRMKMQRSLQLQHQTPSQLPMSSSPSSSQPVPPTSSSPMSHVGPLPHQQQNNVQGRGQGGHGGMVNQGGKQRQGQSQQFQQSSRQHPQQRQQLQSRPTPKVVKVVGKGNIAMHQNGLNSPDAASQVGEEGGQNLYSGTTPSTLPPSNHLVSPAISSVAQTPYVNASAATTKPVQQISSHLDNRNQGKALGPTQGPNSTVVLSRNRQQLQGQPSLKMVNQSRPNTMKMSQQIRPMSSESLSKSQKDHSATDQKALSMGQPQPCVDSSSNVVKRVPESVGDSSLASDSSLVGPSTNQAVANSSGIEPLSSTSHGLVVEKQSIPNNVVSHELEAQWQQQEPLLQSPPLQPVLPQKQ